MLSRAKNKEMYYFLKLFKSRRNDSYLSIPGLTYEFFGTSSLLSCFIPLSLLFLLPGLSFPATNSAAGGSNWDLKSLHFQRLSHLLFILVPHGQNHSVFFCDMSSQKLKNTVTLTYDYGTPWYLWHTPNKHVPDTFASRFISDFFVQISCTEKNAALFCARLYKNFHEPVPEFKCASFLYKLIWACVKRITAARHHRGLSFPIQAARRSN